MIRLLFLLCLSSLIATAENGDTTYVQVHDNTDMTWYGHYKDWGEFPSGDESYRKVLMHFTMGCASTGCSGCNHGYGENNPAGRFAWVRVWPMGSPICTMPDVRGPRSSTWSVTTPPGTSTPTHR